MPCHMLEGKRTAFSCAEAPLSLDQGLPIQPARTRRVRLPCSLDCITGIAERSRCSRKTPAYGPSNQSPFSDASSQDLKNSGPPAPEVSVLAASPLTARRAAVDSGASSQHSRALAASARTSHRPRPKSLASPESHSTQVTGFELNPQIFPLLNRRTNVGWKSRRGDWFGTAFMSLYFR